MNEALAVQQGGGLSVYAPPNIDEALSHYALVKAVIKQIMVGPSEERPSGVHYGPSFPGDKKKNLLKPGADALCVAFKLVPAFEFTMKDLDETGHREYISKCRLTTRDDVLVATGIGICSTMESRYRYRTQNKRCPACGAESIIKGRAEYGGGWICFAKKGGCGAKFLDDDVAITSQPTGQIENPDLADIWNTCAKIAEKRSATDATIRATGCSDEFTQDAEDFAKTEPTPAPAPPQTPPTAPVAAQASAPAQTPKPADKPPQTPVKAQNGISSVDMGTAMQKCRTQAEVEAYWTGTVIPNQSNLPGPVMSSLLKIRREVKAALGGA